MRAASKDSLGIVGNSGRYGGKSITELAAVLSLAILLGLGDPAGAAPRVIKKRVPPGGKQPPTAAQVEGVTDEAVAQAIDRCAKHLLSLQTADGTWGGHAGYPLGPTALATYALLESGMSPKEPRIAKALDALAKGDAKNKTYTLGLRCNAYLAAMKKGANEYRKPLAKDVDTLMKSTKDGSYTYISDGTPRSGDNSNSQYGLLGVWAGAQAELEGISQKYWTLIQDHWSGCQGADGGWSYRGRSGARPTMTAAGVASLFVCYDQLQQYRRGGAVDQKQYDKLNAGLKWLEDHFEESLKPHTWLYYYLYGVERVGLAAGYKYFGTVDWYKLGAARLLAWQQPDGAWGDSVNSSFAILFLVRGRQPVIFNKLQTQGDWNNCPRDCAFATRWLSGKFERDVGWQIINLRVPVEDWHDAPILYLTGTRAPQFSDDDLDKLARFVWQGGMILSSTQVGGGAFQAEMRKAYRKLFPQYPLTVCPPEHPVYKALFQTRGRPGLEIISNGVRPLVIHTDFDLSRAWQQQRQYTGSEAFDIAANIYSYLTGCSFRNRGVAGWPGEPGAKPAKTIRVARLKHDGNCDPEPLAYERLSRLMGKDGKVTLEIVGPIPPAELAKSGAKVATLTGTAEFELPGDAQKTLIQFVEDGGTLVIDAAGGSKEFARSAERLLGLFSGLGRPRTLDGSSPVFKVPGYQIKSVAYRPRTQSRIPAGRCTTEAITVYGRPAVFYSREDITGALVGYDSLTCDGYLPDSAFKLMRNILLSADQK